METILSYLAYLAGNITNKVIGHYISKGLGNIDKELLRAFKDKVDLSKIEKLVSEKSLEKEIIKLSDEVKNRIENNNFGNVLYFNGGVNHGVVANNVELKIIKKSVKIAAPQDSIASSLMHRNYTKHLIDRYHEYKEEEMGKEKMKYPVFYASIKRKFGAKWDMISLDRFAELTSFLQRRIDRTIIGKHKKANAVKRYSSFDEYVSKY